VKGTGTIEQEMKTKDKDEREVLCIGWLTEGGFGGIRGEV
jgi:hypothetical protein